VVDDAEGQTPSPDVVYEWSLWRYAAATAVDGVVAAVIGWLVVGGLFSALSGQFLFRPMGDGLFFVVVYGLVFTVACVLLARRRPAGLRLTADGIELAAARRDSMFVPWSAVSKVRVRWVWPVTAVEVTIAAAQASRVLRGYRGGQAPAQRRRADLLRFSMPLAGLTASSATVRAEFKRRGFSGN
jgi:hypothetical protein